MARGTGQTTKRSISRRARTAVRLPGDLSGSPLRIDHDPRVGRLEAHGLPWFHVQPHVASGRLRPAASRSSPRRSRPHRGGSTSGVRGSEGEVGLARPGGLGVRTRVARGHGCLQRRDGLVGRSRKGFRPGRMATSSGAAPGTALDRRRSPPGKEGRPEPSSPGHLGRKDVLMRPLLAVRGIERSRSAGDGLARPAVAGTIDRLRLDIQLLLVAPRMPHGQLKPHRADPRPGVRTGRGLSPS